MSYSDNYFKSSTGHIFFFADSIPESIELAFEAVCLCGEPSVYRPVAIAGPWDRAKIIGHRARGDILRDLHTETEKEELNRLHSELIALQICYLGAGRAVPAAIAA